MKKTFSILLIAWILLSPAVSTEANAQTKQKRQQKPPVKIVSCKNDDTNCFFQAAQNCRKASGTFTRSINLFGIVVTAATYSEIRGGRNGNCTLYYRTEKVDVKLSEELVRQMKRKGDTPQEIEQAELNANRQADATEKTEGICTFKIENLVSLLQKWKNQQYSTDDWKDANCRGTIFDQTPKSK